MRQHLSQWYVPKQGSGESNSNWRGDAITINSGRQRAIRMFPHVTCRICGETGERHHKDGNPLNNHPSNIDFLCTWHHQELDGRRAKFLELSSKPKRLPDMKVPRVGDVWEIITTNRNRTRLTVKRIVRQAVGGRRGFWIEWQHKPHSRYTWDCTVRDLLTTKRGKLLSRSADNDPAQ